MYRIFLALPKDVDEADERRWQQEVFQVFRKAVPANIEVEVVASRAAYEQDNASGEFQSWDQWIERVATAVDYYDRTPLYNAYASPYLRVGRATASILEQALQCPGSPKMVAARREDGSWGRVETVATNGSPSWRDGWDLTVEAKS